MSLICEIILYAITGIIIPMLIAGFAALVIARYMRFYQAIAQGITGIQHAQTLAMQFLSSRGSSPDNISTFLTSTSEALSVVATALGNEGFISGNNPLGKIAKRLSAIANHRPEIIKECQEKDRTLQQLAIIEIATAQTCLLICKPTVSELLMVWKIASWKRNLNIASPIRQKMETMHKGTA